jgi:hypothetical protein
MGCELERCTYFVDECFHAHSINLSVLELFEIDRVAIFSPELVHSHEALLPLHGGLLIIAATSHGVAFLYFTVLR